MQLVKRIAAIALAFVISFSLIPVHVRAIDMETEFEKNKCCPEENGEISSIENQEIENISEEDIQENESTSEEVEIGSGETETGIEEDLESKLETTDEDSDGEIAEKNWLSLGMNPVLTGEENYFFSPEYTGYYQFECSYMLSVNIKNPDGYYLQRQQCLGTLYGLYLEAGMIYTVETSTSFDDATLLVREIGSEIEVGKQQLDRSGLYLFSPEEEGYYSVIGSDFEIFHYIYDDFEGEWYEQPVSQPDHCYLTKQNYYIWIKNAPGGLEISHADPQYVQVGFNNVSDGWYQFIPEISGFYHITNLREIEGNAADWFYYNERLEYGFAGAEGYYLNADQNYRIYYEDVNESTIVQETTVMRSKEGLDYFVYDNQAMVIGYGGSNTLVWPERIDNLSICLVNKDLHELFHRTGNIDITFPASIIGFVFDISFEWNEWKTNTPSVVSVKHVDDDQNSFKGQLVLKNSGTANVLLIARDAENPSHEHQYSITVEKNMNAKPDQEESAPDRSENSDSGKNASNQDISSMKTNSKEIAFFQHLYGDLHIVSKYLVSIIRGLVFLLSLLKIVG